MELYVKHRPKKFEDVIGNEIAIKTIKKELENGTHVFLFTGPAGCGKTTLARIVANEVGANELSVQEINSAENRGIDTMREVLTQMRFNPAYGENSVWIFDECHQWTVATQNASLKALEEVPESVYFILCTTDPQKLIEPLKSRCSIINVKPLDKDNMVYLLRKTAKAEGVKVGIDVYERIADLAEGGSRKALKLLAKVINLDNDEERLEALEDVDADENPETIELCRALMNNRKGKSESLKLVKALDLSDSEKVRMAVMGYMTAVILNSGGNQRAECALQAFSEADTYRNSKFAITVAVLDFYEMVG